MKWLIRISMAVLALLLVGAGLVYWSAWRPANPVGFQLARASANGDAPLSVAIWYPTRARPWPTVLIGPVLMALAKDAPVERQGLPLVVISHGNGGGPQSHADLALSLASAGYVVVAPLHRGDNFTDQSRAGSPTLFSDRVSDLNAAVEYMLSRWPEAKRVDGARVGAFGLSAGGFTVLTAAGAQPDLRLIGPHCQSTPEFVCQVFKQVKSPLLAAETAWPGEPMKASRRIKAAVIAAPGLGFAFGPQGLAGVNVPVQQWSGESDQLVPYDTNAKLIRQGLGSKVDFHSVPLAGHASFLTPCRLLRPPALCADPDGFDREQFHQSMNKSVVEFFNTNLRQP